MLQGLPTGLSNVKHSKEEAAASMGQTSSKPGRLFRASMSDARAVFVDFLDPSFSAVLVCSHSWSASHFLESTESFS